MNESYPFAARTRQIRSSRIREILKTTARPDVISFAGGLPDPDCLPLADMQAAASRVFAAGDSGLLQYSISEGLPELRAWIADRYRRRFGLDVSPEEILITNGSQQALDLIGKVFINRGDPVYVEKPAYLGALQSLAFYEPDFRGVALEDDGVDLHDLRLQVARRGPGVFYCVPNFQNPSGATYDLERRETIAAMAARGRWLLIEDDPYGELRYDGRELPPIRAFHRRALLLGSFSKIVSPGLRLGWVVAPSDVMSRLIAAKQAADLHTNVLGQRILFEYLSSHELDLHIEELCRVYRARRDAMVAALVRHFPEAGLRIPQGGMFLWCRLPRGLSAEALTDRALENGVAVVPGTTFFVDRGGDRYLRLNFTNASEETILTGCEGLGRIARETMTLARGA